MMKFHSTTKELKGNTWAKFYHVMSNFKEMLNKTVFRDGGPDAILNISVISNVTFLKI